MPFLTFLPMTESNHSYLCNEGATFFFWTNQEADLGKVIAVDAETRVQTDIIPESRCSLDHVIPVGNYFAARFSDDVISRLVLFNRQGRELREIPLPGMGTAVFVEAPLPYLYKKMNCSSHLQILYSPLLFTIMSLSPAGWKSLNNQN